MSLIRMLSYISTWVIHKRSDSATYILELLDLIVPLMLAITMTLI